MAKLPPGIPFTRSKAVAAGLTPRELAGPGYLRLHRGCFVSARPQPTPITLVSAAFLLTPHASFVCYETAALMYGAIVPESPLIHLGTLTECRSKREAIVVHRYGDRPQLRPRNGVSITTPERTFVDLAERLSLIDLVVLGDSLLSRGVTSREQLSTVARESAARGARCARKAAEYVRLLVDSPQESRLRMLLVLAGLPEPTVNIVLRDADGQIRRRLDLGWESAKLAVEYDGRQHITSDEAWRADLRRREELANDGWAVVVVTAHDLRADPGAILERVVAAMRAQGMRAPRLRDDWRRHFPPR